MMSHAMKTPDPRCIPWLAVAVPILATLLLLGACKRADPPFLWGGGGGSSDDDDDDFSGVPDNTWAVARVEVTRSHVEGTTSAVIRALGSWFPNQPVTPRPDVPNDVDTCHGGSSPSGEYVIPDSTWDIGDLILVMADGEHNLDFDNDHFEDILPYNAWNPNDEFDISVSGGPNLDATEFTGALGTPPSIAITELVEAGGSVSVSWLGGQDMDQLTILVTATGNDSLYWVACRARDDGEFTLSAADLAPLPVGGALLDLRRERSADIEVGDNIGVVMGISSASAGISVIETGDDDDSAR